MKVPFDVALFALILEYDLSGEAAARKLREVADGIAAAVEHARPKPTALSKSVNPMAAGVSQQKGGDLSAG